MLVRTEKLTKEYRGFRALDQLNLAIPAGEIFGLLGPNGSGKSTALRLLMGFLHPTSGGAWIDGHHCWSDNLQARARIAYLPGELRLYENMTGGQLLHFLAQLRGQRIEGEEAALARRLDIDLNRPIAHLSSGMKRKLALLQVLVPRVPLLILDEPTNTLDPTMRDEFLASLLEAKKKGQTVLFSSHVLAEVEHVCDRVGILQRGRLVHVQHLDELRESRQVVLELEKPRTDLPPLAGLIIRETHANQLLLEHQGPLAPLLDWLRLLQPRDVKIQPLGLSGIYSQYHGRESCPTSWSESSSAIRAAG